MGAANSEPPAGEASGRAWFVLAILLTVFVFSHVDRQILNILLESIRKDLEFSDTVMGLLTGPAFVLFYTVAGVPFARISDRRSRRMIITFGLAAWSMFTVAQGFAKTLAQFATARVLVGVGEATMSPASHSIIADYFPPHRRSLALGIFALGGHIGMLGLIFGGWMDANYGWRAAFFAVGVPGLVFALFVPLLVKEPVRGQSEARRDEGDTPSALEAFRFMWSQRSFRHLTIAASLYVLTAYGFNVWGPAFLQRIHGMGVAETGLWFGLATSIPGVLGTLLAGYLCDRLAPRDARWTMWLSAIGGLAMLPLALGFLFLEDPKWALICYAPQVFLGTFYMAPTFSQTQGLATLRMRATATAVLLLVINVVGAALGPQLSGLLSDALRGTFGDESLRYAMLILPAASLWGALHSMLAARTLREDLARAAQA